MRFLWLLETSRKFNKSSRTFPSPADIYLFKGNERNTKKAVKYAQS